MPYGTYWAVPRMGRSAWIDATSGLARSRLRTAGVIVAAKPDTALL
jgi:hypothetical protein